MLPFKIAPPRWGLLLHLLTPIVLVALGASLILHIVGSASANREVAALMGLHGSAVLEGLTGLLEERQDSKEAIAVLLSKDEGLVDAVARRDKGALQRALAPHMSSIDLEEVVVYSGDGQEMLRFGPDETGVDLAPLVATALRGSTVSNMLVESKGLAVIAATPVADDKGVIGALAVGSTIDSAALKEIGRREEVELAAFKNGHLVAGTTDQPELLAVLDNPALVTAGLPRLNAALARYDFYVQERSLADDGLLLALVSNRDVSAIANWRSMLLALVSVGLLIALAIADLLLARSIAGHLQSVVTAAKDMTRGNYRRWVARSHVWELNELGGAINDLGQQLEVQLAELNHQAFYDPLSNLPNRALFMDRLGRALARAGRRRESVAVMFLDLDNFKVINDSLGHRAGDQLLVLVAERLQLCVRQEDSVARLGGDEFTVLFEEIPALSTAIHLAERIAEHLRTPFSIEGHELSVTASIGIALAAAGYDQPDDLLRNADLAMYRAKAKGKACYEVFDRSLNVLAMDRLELEGALRRAVEHKEFKVCYQPIVRLQSSGIAEVEALVRWEHPQRGLVLPEGFISVAEETGLILPIGQWVLEEACRQAQGWQAQYPSDTPLGLCVNLSARQFQHRSLATDIARTLRQTGLDPHSLTLEITEGILMEGGEGTLAILSDLKGLGVKLAIDDFGTGYSSLAYLKHFPIDVLKIDRSFVEGLGKDAEDTAIVRTIVTLGKTLGLSVTGEGIESYEQLIHLRALGCDHGQGYYFAKPLSSDRVGALLAAASPVGIGMP